MAPGEPPRKPWGAPASYGRGAKKPPAVGARARRSSAPVYNPPVPRAARGDDDEGDSAPSRAGTVDDANFRAWQRVASNAKASSRPEKDPTPPSPFGSDIDALAAPDGSYVPLGEHTHASFHDLGPEEKRKVAKLIRQVVELSEARSKLEKELDELRARCVTEEGARKDAQAAEANGRAEIETLRGKLARALATINALARGDARGSLAMGQASGELTITPLPDTPAKAAVSNVAANGVVSEPTDDASIDSCAHRSTVGSPPETIVVRTSGAAREEATPTPSTPPAVVIAAAAAAAAAAENAAAPANAKAATTAKPPPGSPFIPGLSPGSARDLRWLSAVQSGTSRAPAWAKASMLAAAARNAAALKTAPGSDSSSPVPVTPVSATRSARSGATMNMTLSPDSSVSVAAPSPPNVNDAGRPADTPHESSRSAKDGEGLVRRERTPSSAPELPPEVLDAAKRAAAADPDDPLVAALAAAAAAQAGIHWEPFGMNSPAGVGSPRAAAAAEQGGGAERPKVLRFDPEMGPSGAFYFADASVDTTSASSMAAGSPVGDPGGGDSFDSSFAVERVHAHTSAAETNEGTESGEESAAPKKKGGGGGDVVADVAEKVTGRTVAAVLGVDEDGRRVSAEEAARFMLRVDREMTSYAAAAAAPQSAPVTHPSPPGFMAPPTATRRHRYLDHDATFAFSDASFSAVVHPPDMSPPSRIIEEFLVLKGTTPAPAACDGDKVFKKQQSTGAPSPETAAALEACLGVTEPRADPVGDHVSSAPVTPVRAFDEFVKRRHGDGRASSIVQIAAEQVRLGAANNTSGARGARAGATSASSPAPPPSSLGGFGAPPSGKKPAFVLTPNSLATRREKAAAVAERLLALERTEAAAGEVVAAERVEVPSPSPESPPAEAAAARTPAPVAWEIPSPEPPPAEAGSKPAKSKPAKSKPVESTRRRAVAGADGTPPREKDTPARLLDDARAFAFDVSLVDLVDEAEAMLREEEDEEEDEETRTRGGATNHKPPSPRTGDTKRRASGGAGGRVTPAGRKNPQGSSKGSRAPLGPMRQRDYNKFGGVRTPPSGGERKKPGWFTSYRSFSVGRAGEPGL